jgi:FHA domain
MQSTFIIIREDLQVDPITIVGDSILIGRIPTCELLLNHPSVSRLQAGLTHIEGDYFIRNLRPSNAITLNGQPVAQYTALTAGDVLGIGPFALNIDFLEDALALKVSLQIAATPEEAVVRRQVSGFWDLPTTSHLSLPGMPTDPQTPAHKRSQPRKPKPAAERAQALDVFWNKRITAATKTIKPSLLFPMRGRPSGKAQSVWTSTTDLKPESKYLQMFAIATVVAVLASAGAFLYARAFSPRPISSAHARSALTLSPPVAARANSGSCSSCHQWNSQMDAACTSCHTTDAFAATVIQPHLSAGIDCVTCHAEHRGEDFNAIDGALLSCSECHNDNNKQIYNGKSVATPHGGTFGYPVANGHWTWPGLDTEELAQRKAELKLERLPSDSEDIWRSKQFHALHPYRVMAAAGMSATKNGELGCSSCHTTSRRPVDTLTPRVTCGKCHNGQPDARAGHQVIASDKPNCTSCHIQHMKDKRHWNPGLLPKN